MFTKKFMTLIAMLFLLTSCETASQKAVSGSASSGASKTVQKAAKKSSSLFAKASETPAQKLISVGDRVLFGYDSAELSAEAKLTLDQQSRFLRANADLTFTIEGHCDERGTREYNLALGERRGNSVRDFLVSLGVDAGRITVISYGKERPAAEGSTSESWAENRRAVTVVGSN